MFIWNVGVYFNLFCVIFRGGVVRFFMYGGLRMGGGFMFGFGFDGYFLDYFIL